MTGSPVILGSGGRFGDGIGGSGGGTGGSGGVGVGLLAALLGGCIHVAEPTLTPEATFTYETADGWRNELRRFPAQGPPVLLVHGMGANHYNWDYRPDVSLAHYLQQRGWDVWVVELRGDPGSVGPTRQARRRFTFDDHARLDLPAAVDAVLQATHQDQLFWVGHSMGGMLLYTYLAQQPEEVAAGVAICSPSTFEHLLPLHRTGRAFAWTLGGDGRLPNRALAGMSRPLGRHNPLFGKLANRDNLDWPTANGLAKHALVDLPKPLLRQAVLWTREGDLVTADGEPWVVPADVPLRVFGAVDDKIVSPLDVAHTCDVFPDCEYTLLSRETGFSVDYGHIDPVIGRTAESEVYPLVLAFLEAHRPGAVEVAWPERRSDEVQGAAAEPADEVPGAADEPAADEGSGAAEEPAADEGSGAADEPAADEGPGAAEEPAADQPPADEGPGAADEAPADEVSGAADEAPPAASTQRGPKLP